MWSLGARKTIKRKQCVSGKRGNVFICASSAVIIHKITAASTPLFASSDAALPDLTAAFYETLEGHLNNIATAVTNKKAILRKLVETNAFLAKLTAKKFEQIEKLLLEANSAASHGTPTSSTCRPAPSIDHDRTVSQIHVAFKKKWVIRGFCSTHGWGVGPK